jgi:hypothetical protein
MTELTPPQYQQILQIAAAACGGSPAARAKTLEFSSELTDGEWNPRTFFIRLANLLGPVQDRIPVFRTVAGRDVSVGNFRYRDAMALICARLMVRSPEFRIPDPNVLIPLMAMFRLGWELITINDIGIRHVGGPDDVPPAPPVPLPEIKIPAGQEDVISMAPIPDGTRMVDFHGERAKHRYYTEATYNALNPKKNPYTRQAIEPNQVTRYIAKLDSTLPVQQAGRRRKTKKSKRRARKTRRHHK